MQQLKGKKKSTLKAYVYTYKLGLVCLFAWLLSNKRQNGWTDWESSNPFIFATWQFQPWI